MTPHAPPSVERTARWMRHLAVAVAALFYVSCMAVVVYAAIDIFTTCTSNFEGGCSMGKSWKLLLSLAPAVAAVGMGALLGSLVAAYPGRARAGRVLRMVLSGLPLAYCAYGLLLLF